MANEYTVPAVHRAVQVLEILAGSHTGHSLADLSRQTGIPKSSLFRILLTLEKVSIVQLDRARNIYNLGMKLIDWGNRALDKIDLKTITHPHLVRMSHETKESYYICILDDYEVIIIDRADTPEVWRMVARLGQRSPVHATASGQVLIAEAGDEAMNMVVGRTGLKRFTPRTLTSAARLKERLKEVRRTGFVIADAEYKPDLCAIAVPIRDHHGKITAALMTALQTERVRRNRSITGEMIDFLKKEGAMISREIGYQGPPA
ncbi:MAG: IclR family transcriptional regulator [Bacteroidetes bacterium]|nr:IclR family transcriptional regulator [Bacteroidota bacterium]